MTENEISEKIIGCSIEVHKSLGPGLLESAYQECLFYELQKAGLYVEKQKPLPQRFAEILTDNRRVLRIYNINSIDFSRVVNKIWLCGSLRITLRFSAFKFLLHLDF
jgi:hypothetical protein